MRVGVKAPAIVALFELYGIDKSEWPFLADKFRCVEYGVLKKQNTK